MVKRLADHLPRVISQYVPNMAFAADILNGATLMSLGAPSTADPNGIFTAATATDSVTNTTSSSYATTFDGSSTHVGESVAGKINAKFGRCLTATGSAGSNHVLTITGRDYLGQIMKENMTLSTAAVILGNKAFAYVDSCSAAAGASGDTYALGWTDRLGLPYKAEKVLCYTEDDVSFPVTPVDVLVEVDAVRFAAGTDVIVPSPIKGQITGVNSVVTTELVEASTATVIIGSTDVAGLSLVIAASATVATLDSDTATTDDDATGNTVAKYGAMGISPDSTPTAGAANYLITVEPLTFIPGPDTDPQTATTADPRGTILVSTACDASIVYEVGFTCDLTDLHGVEHFTS